MWPLHSWKIILYYYNKNCYEHHKVSSKFYKNILPLCTIALWHIVNRTAVQNKVTTRFNKLIYFFKDVQCTFFLIQGFRVSGYFYLHIYRPQTALITSENADKEQSLNCYLDATNRSQNTAESITGRHIQRLKKSLWKNRHVKAKGRSRCLIWPSIPVKTEVELSMSLVYQTFVRNSQVVAQQGTCHF